MRIAIIGNGNVATSLHAAFSKKGIEAPMISSRELTSGVGEPLTEADVYIYAVRDEALREVIAAVHAPARSVHVHTSGTVPISVFGEDKPHCGILYPFQTFSKAQPIDDFTDIPLFIEAKNIDDVAAVWSMSGSSTENGIEVPFNISAAIRYMQFVKLLANTPATCSRSRSACEASITRGESVNAKV